uniref:Uncharacterized protein n=1 Tax=Solanum lycopersicum TaxID=4081 RepID=A0A3Q7EBQ2_SOLLC
MTAEDIFDITCAKVISYSSQHIYYHKEFLLTLYIYRSNPCILIISMRCCPTNYIKFS